MPKFVSVYFTVSVLEKRVIGQNEAPNKSEPHLSKVSSYFVFTDFVFDQPE